MTGIYRRRYYGVRRHIDRANWIGSKSFIPISLYETLLLSYQPKSFWRMDESAGPNATDAIGHVTGTYVNSPTFSSNPVVFGGLKSVTMVKANGSGLQLGSSYYFTGTAPFTAITWCDLAAYDGAAGHIIMACSDSTARGWALYLGNPAITILAERGDAAGFDLIQAQVSQAYFESRRNFVGIRYDGTNLSIWWNDSQLISNLSSKSLVAPATSTHLRLGAHPQGGSGFDGPMDDTAIFDYALSDTQLLNLWNAGEARSNLTRSRQLRYCAIL